MTDDKTTHEEIVDAYCLDAIDYAKSFGIELDYSEDSVKKIEEIAAILHNEFPKNFFAKLFKKEPSGEEVEACGKILGHYISKVFIKHNGGKIVWSDFFSGIGVRHEVCGNFCPWQKVCKRIVNGSEDNVWDYYWFLRKQVNEEAA